MSNVDRPRCVLYLRVSTDEQGRSGYSIPDQRRVLEEHAGREGWRVVEEIVDDGYSGADPHRPGLRRVMELASEGAIDVVLATKRDRFFRSRLYRLLTEQDLTEMGVRMVALNDTGNRLADGFQDDFAEYEREQIRERTMRGLEEKVRSGKVIRGAWNPYGFRFSADGNSLVVHDQEMAVVVRLFAGLAEGRIGAEVTGEFEDEGIPSPGGLLRWSQWTVRNLLRSELYRPISAAKAAERVAPEVAATLDPSGATPYGLWTYRGRRKQRRRREWDTEKGAYRYRYTSEARPEEERLVVPVSLAGSGLDAAVVDAAREQAKNRSRKPSTAGGRYWVLKGLIRCAECGAASSPYTVNRRRADGTPAEKSSYYRCQTRYAHGPRTCTNTRSNPAEALEGAVWDVVHGLITNPRKLQQAYDEERKRLAQGHRDDPGKETKKLAARLSEIDEERRGYLRLAARGSLGDDELDEALAGLGKEREEAEEALEEARNRRDGLDTLRREIDMLWARSVQIRDQELRYLAPEDKRRVLRSAKVRAEIDREGRVKITGMLFLDVTRLLPTDGPYRTDPERPEPPPFKGVVTMGNTSTAAAGLQ